MVLSGDIHRNESDAFHTGGWPLHEATSSGAAVRDAVVVGKTQENHGLLEIEGDRVTTSLFARNQRQSRWSRSIHRQSWIPD